MPRPKNSARRGAGTSAGAPGPDAPGGPHGEGVPVPGGDCDDLLGDKGLHLFFCLFFVQVFAQGKRKRNETKKKKEALRFLLALSFYPPPKEKAKKTFFSHRNRHEARPLAVSQLPGVVEAEREDGAVRGQDQRVRPAGRDRDGPRRRRERGRDHPSEPPAGDEREAAQGGAVSVSEAAVVAVAAGGDGEGGLERRGGGRRRG